jgi:hypothetical protein
MKALAGFGPDTTSTVTAELAAILTMASPVEPLSTHTWLMVGAIRFTLRRGAANAARSCAFAEESGDPRPCRVGQIGHLPVPMTELRVT